MKSNLIYEGRRKPLLLCFLAIVSVIISCKKDNEDSQNDIQTTIMNKLSGTWERKSINYEEIDEGATVELTFSEYGVFSSKNISSKNNIGSYYTKNGDYIVSKDGRYIETPKFSGDIFTNERGKDKFAILQLNDNALNLDGIEFVRTSTIGNNNEIYDKSLIVGTWKSTSYHGWDSKKNAPVNPAYHLFSFSSDGSGYVIEFANEFMNFEEDFYGLCRRVSTTWSLNKDILTISGEKEGIVWIKSLSDQSIETYRGEGEYGFSDNSFFWNVERPTFDRVSNNPDWFYDEGPLVYDMTSLVTGYYSGKVYRDDVVVDQYASMKITKKPNNNYVVNVEHSWNHKIDGIRTLHWRDLFNPYKEKEDGVIKIYQPGNHQNIFIEVSSDNSIVSWYLGSGLSIIEFRGKKLE